MNYPVSETMTAHECGGVVYYTFNALDDLTFIRHCFSTRLGGVSTGAFSSMNLSFSRGDDSVCVINNFSAICHGALGASETDVVLSAQRHNTVVYRAEYADRGRGITRETGYTDIDGLMTDKSGVVLCTQYADCVPLFFADPVRRVVATSHAGWRGTAARMGRETVYAMCTEYGCDPTDIIAGIGPSIGACCFEVDMPVADVFYGIEEADGAITDDGCGKFHIDMWEVNRRTLLLAGLSPEHIAVGGLCTRCHPDIFWSHRVHGTQRGSLAAFIKMKERN